MSKESDLLRFMKIKKFTDPTLHKLYVEFIQTEQRQKPRPQFSMEEDLQTLAKKVYSLEKKHITTDSRIDDLEFRTNMSSLNDVIGDITQFIIQEFEPTDFVKKVLYSPLEEGGLQITIIHNLIDRVDALKKSRKYIHRVTDAFPGIYFEPIILHVSEVRPEHELGTITIIKK